MGVGVGVGVLRKRTGRSHLSGGQDLDVLVAASALVVFSSDHTMVRPGESHKP